MFNIKYPLIVAMLVSVIIFLLFSEVECASSDQFWGEKMCVTITRYTSSDFVANTVFTDSVWVRESKDQFTIKLSNGYIKYLPKSRFDLWPCNSKMGELNVKN